jgi:hypothetical protein
MQFSKKLVLWELIKVTYAECNFIDKTTVFIDEYNKGGRSEIMRWHQETYSNIIKVITENILCNTLLTFSLGSRWDNMR